MKPASLLSALEQNQTPSHQVSNLFQIFFMSLFYFFLTSFLFTRKVVLKFSPSAMAVLVWLSQPSVAATVSDWQAISESRIEHLSAVCKNSSLSNLTHVSISKFVLDRIFVCDKRQILFCQTPKVGNTQWKKVLIVLNGEYGMDWCTFTGVTVGIYKDKAVL